MFLTIKLAILCLVSFVFGFTVVMANVTTAYFIVLLCMGLWNFNNVFTLIVLIPSTFGLNLVLWYIVTELASVFRFGQRPRRGVTD